MRFKRWLAVAALAVAPLAIATHTQAQTPLDAPTLRVTAESQVSVALEVVAGPSGAPAGFVVEWMGAADFARLGGWPVDPAAEPALVRSQFYGTPTLNPSTGSFRLGPGGAVQVELGDLFDETGVTTTCDDELPSGDDLVLRARAVATTLQSGSAYSATLAAHTRPLTYGNCTHGQGFWRRHAAMWPVGQLTLGANTYSAAQVLSILKTPARGNGLVFLAHQLIAAQLNVANGADPTPVVAAIAAADQLIGGLVVPPVGAGTLRPAEVSGVKEVLDGYNSGLAGVPRCGQVPTRSRTWGGVKAVYR
jgi:hypothetical protein